MLTPYVFTSVTRIADLQTTGFDVAELPRDQWADGDYIVANVTGKPSVLYKFELTNGRIVEAMEGTPAVGAFGKRAATLEATGDWAAIGDDGSRWRRSRERGCSARPCRSHPRCRGS